MLDLSLKYNFASLKLTNQKTLLIESFDNKEFEVCLTTDTTSELLDKIYPQSDAELKQKVEEILQKNSLQIVES